MAHRGKDLVAIFRDIFASAKKNFFFGRGAGHWAIILWGLDTFLTFLNFLRSSVLSRSATREITRIYHVYK